MKFPTLPTDNLYKFYSITGLVIALFSIYMAYKSYTDVFIELERLEYMDAYIEIDQLMLSNDKCDSSIFIKEENKIEKAKVDFQISAKKLMKKSENLVNVTIGFIVLIFLGIAVGWRGFYLWQTRTQCYQDTILKLTAINLEEPSKTS